MSDGNLPSKDPADESTLGGAFRAIFRKLLQGVDGMLPARVIAYDRENNAATVQPMVAVLTTDGSAVSRANVARVPVLALGSNRFAINFPLQPGDLGWIEASDRDISLYMQSLNEAQPNTLRLHSFEDARFIPDALRNFDVSDVAADAMTIQVADGTTRVTISPTMVHIKSASNVHIEAAANVTHDAAAHVFNGPVTFNDHTEHKDGATINGIEHATHKHVGVTAGSGTSGVPTA